MTESDILAGASQRISRHRKAALTIRVVDAEGTPVKGAEVRVEQVRHGFLFGCNVFMLNRLPTPELEQQYRDRFAALLNYATLPFYWGGFEPQRGKPEYRRIDGILEWCKAQRIACKGHPLVWNHPASTPAWLPEDLSVIKGLSDTRVSEIVSRYRGKLDVWDVVNEATDPFRFENPMSDMWKKSGVMPLTIGSFRIARDANPAASLLINDYRTDTEYEHVIELLTGSEGKPLYDMIGLQSHMHGGVWPVRKTWEVCERFSRFKVPLHFTETTVVSGPKTEREWDTTPEGERRQADSVVKLYTTLFSHPAVEAITWWDFADLGAWQQAPAGLLRKDLSPKPAYDQLLELVKQKWWTRETKRAGEDGTTTLRAFHGRHRITATAPAGLTATQVVHLTKQGGEFLLTVK